MYAAGETKPNPCGLGRFKDAGTICLNNKH